MVLILGFSCLDPYLTCQRSAIVFQLTWHCYFSGCPLSPFCENLTNKTVRGPFFWSCLFTLPLGDDTVRNWKRPDAFWSELLCPNLRWFALFQRPQLGRAQNSEWGVLLTLNRRVSVILRVLSKKTWGTAFCHVNAQFEQSLIRAHNFRIRTEGEPGVTEHETPRNRSKGCQINAQKSMFNRCSGMSVETNRPNRQ